MCFCVVNYLIVTKYVIKVHITITSWKIRLHIDKMVEMLHERIFVCCKFFIIRIQTKYVVLFNSMFNDILPNKKVELLGSNSYLHILHPTDYINLDYMAAGK